MFLWYTFEHGVEILVSDETLIIEQDNMQHRNCHVYQVDKAGDDDDQNGYQWERLETLMKGHGMWEACFHTEDEEEQIVKGDAEMNGYEVIWSEAWVNHF